MTVSECLEGVVYTFIPSTITKNRVLSENGQRGSTKKSARIKIWARPYLEEDCYFSGLRHIDGGLCIPLC